MNEEEPVSEKEWVLRSLEKLVDDFTAGKLSESAYMEKIGHMEKLVARVQQEFLSYYDNLARVSPEMREQLYSTDEETRNSLETIKSFFSRAFKGMKLLPMGASSHYMDEALTCASYAMDEVARLDSLSGMVHRKMR